MKTKNGTKFLERPFFESDLGALLKIEQTAGAASWNAQQIKFSTNSLERDTRIITMEDSDEAIAFYVVEHGDDTLYIANLAVRIDWRRKGVALFALDAAVELGCSLNYSHLALHVQEQNLGAQILYRKAGFHLIEILHGFYDDGQDGFHMIKKIILSTDC